jgi:hypothetical protein
MSLNLPYHPATLPASNLLESLRNQSVRLIGPNFYFKNQASAKVIRHCKRVIRFNSWEYCSLLRRRMMQITYSLPKRILTLSALRGFKRQQDRDRTRRAAEQLRRIAEMPSYLSDESLFYFKLNQIVTLLHKLQL